MGSNFSFVERRYDLAIAIGLAILVEEIVRNTIRKKKNRKELLDRCKKQKQQLQTANLIYFKDAFKHLSIRQTGKAPIYKIAITGGPCAGKTSCLSLVKQYFQAKGYRVYYVYEIPTMVVYAGGMILLSKFTPQQRIKFQTLLIRHQMETDDYITTLASMGGQPSIVLCDRGTMDTQAYISQDQFQSILDQEGWNKIVLRDRRYDSVCVLASAANGAEQFYSLQNNAARHQTVEQAKALDKKTLQAWVGHPNLTIVPNVKGENFKDKMQRVIMAIQKTVGIEIKGAYYPKYLIKKPIFPPGVRIQHFQTLDMILINDNPDQFDEIKLSQQGNNNSFVYQKRIRYKRQNIGQFRRQITNSLTSTQFVTLLQKKDPNYNPLFYKRSRFAYNNNYYCIDKYQIDGQKAYVLRFFCKKNQELSEVPEFCEIIREVTKQIKFTVAQMARKIK